MERPAPAPAMTDASWAEEDFAAQMDEWSDADADETFQIEVSADVPGRSLWFAVPMAVGVVAGILWLIG